jgi:hypothetical protein
VDDDLGTVTVNVVDALMAIAFAMTRLADIYEKSSAMML